MGRTRFLRSLRQQSVVPLPAYGGRSFSAGLFDAAAKHAIEKEIFVDERADWCRIEGDHPRQTGAEVIAEAEAAGFKFN